MIENEFCMISDWHYILFTPWPIYYWFENPTIIPSQADTTKAQQYDFFFYAQS